MSKEIQTFIRRAPTDVVQDLFGALSLVVILVAGLHLPGFF
jgi:hypothetical protein